MADEKTFKERSEVNLNSIGGGIAGSGLGYLATIPLNQRYEKSLLEQAGPQYQDQQISKKHWDMMFRIAKGHVPMESLSPSDQKFYAKKIAENEQALLSMLNDPREYQEMKKSFDRGQVLPFTGETKKKGLNIGFKNLKNLDTSNVKSIAPRVPLEDLMQLGKLKNPHPRSGSIPLITGLLGMALAGEVTHLKQKERKKNEEE